MSLLSRRRCMLHEEKQWDYECYPENPDQDSAGRIKCKLIPVKMGDKFIIAYHATKKIGYIYDGRKSNSHTSGIGCGIEYLGSVMGTAHPINNINCDEETEILEARNDGYIVISNCALESPDGKFPIDGEYAKYEKDIAYCKYIKFKFV